MDKKYLEFLNSHPEWFINPEGGIEIITAPDLVREVEEKYHTSLGVIYEDDYLILLKDAVRFTDQVIAPYIRAYHKKPGGVSVLVICQGQLLLLKHFRHSLRTWLWETPRGFSESNQSPLENAMRELYEEIGVYTTNIEPLGVLAPDAGIIGERISLFYSIIEPDSLIRLEAHEGIFEHRLFSKQQVQAMIASGEITDGITISSLYMAELRGLL